MNSLEIREAKMALIDEVNKIQLPLEVKRMMLGEIMTELCNATNREIDSLLDERRQMEERKAEEDGQDE